MVRATEDYEAMTTKELMTRNQQLTGLISDRFSALSEQFSRTPATRLLIAEVKSAVDEQQIIMLIANSQLQADVTTVISEHRQDLMTLLGRTK